jgi:hypothetical protein
MLQRIFLLTKNCTGVMMMVGSRVCTLNSFKVGFILNPVFHHADPFSLCQSIDNFVAAEVAVYPNTSMRLIVIAHRLSDDFLANSTLSIFDSHFNDLSTPISMFPGRLSILNTMPNPVTGGNTTLIAYGGLMHYNYYAPDQHGDCGFGCVYVLFIEMNLVQSQGIQNSTSAFIPSGGFFETRMCFPFYFLPT